MAAQSVLPKPRDARGQRAYEAAKRMGYCNVGSTIGAPLR